MDNTKTGGKRLAARQPFEYRRVNDNTMRGGLEYEVRIKQTSRPRTSRPRRREMFNGYYKIIMDDNSVFSSSN